MPDKKKSKGVLIKADEELIEILDILEDKIKDFSGYSIERITKRDLTRILARKVKDARLV